MRQYNGTFRPIWGKIGALILFSTCFAAYAYAAANPQKTEELYSRGVYPQIVKAWAGITSRVSFSIAEILVYVIAVCVAARVVRTLVRVVAERTAAGRVFYLVDLLLSGAVFAAMICFLFIAMWGLNYNRLPFSETSGLVTAPTSALVLEQSCALLAEQTNELREAVREDGDGVAELSVPLRNTLERAKEGFWATATEFETLGDIEPTRAKPVFSSGLMSYAGITGVYFPITAEANVNADVTGAEIPFTICHELAHQLGYAREDEANFVAWLACVNSPYEDYRYSGSVMAMLQMLRELESRDAAAWQRVRGSCSDAVNRDLAAMGLYWQKHEGPVSEVSETINDTFLKANNQQDGVQSYGRMVDLIIAYFIANGLQV